ncbi:endonuclease G [Bradyrhizobium sp. S3.2.6]|uniref:DNA/RNA non-specific endonuclease n=1 Tax=Bradyrhizobium sp. S3.2.6 TaxID=3156428 RepID=UPI0033912C8A
MTDFKRTDTKQLLERLRRFNQSIRENDPKLAAESMDKMPEQELALELPEEEVRLAVEAESIAMRQDRPVLAIKNNTTDLDIRDPAERETWFERLRAAKPLLDAAIPAVGRINLIRGEMSWVGTGWLVRDGVIVTNRHVALKFALRRGEGFSFRMGLGGPMAGAVDFLEEVDSNNELIFNLVRPLHIADTSGPDVAFFEVALVSGNSKLAKPIVLASHIAPSANVSTIGYPAFDSRIPEPELMQRIYGDVYNKKRLAPGAVTRVETNRIWHNCTTLGGNSGSVVIANEQEGEALGLHFGGAFLSSNYAVRADVVKQLLEDVLSGRAARRRRPATPESGVTATSKLSPANAVPLRPFSTTLSIPLTVKVSIELDHTRSAQPRPSFAPSSVPDASDDEADEFEATAEDFRDRAGYEPDFLGDGEFDVALPAVVRNAADVLRFEFDGKTETELRYEHFSVLMSKSRRMCIVSACNIDGNQSRRTGRGSWKFDPRIPKPQQIKNECYGDPPKFSRGHMTRREDPAWGTPATASRGNSDSMHVTNATPQMQAFNAPIWLALEDFALQHAREDAMKISVFTGPYFASDDPERDGVRIPVAFWKVIAFIHDQTGRLCATGYEMSQQQNLPPEEEFVFGQFVSPQLNVATQVPIRSIEARSGISFGSLAALDPLANTEETVGEGEAHKPLLSFDQIRFT